MIPTFVSSLAAFIATSIDDLFILTILGAGAQTRSSFRRMIGGYLAGIALLTLASFIISRLAQALPGRYLALTGLIPIALGVRQALSRDDEASGGIPTALSFLSIALVTVANGADNLGVYIPLFSGFSMTEMLCAALVFVSMAYLWCLLSRRIASFPALESILRRHRRFLVPAVLILLGLSILLKTFP